MRSCTWDEAAVRWLRESAGKASVSTDELHLRWLQPFLTGRLLSAIDTDLVESIIAAAVVEGRSPATVNRRLEVLRAVLRRAALRWGWLDRTPYVRMLREPKRRIRFLTRPEAQGLLAQLPSHLAAMARFTLYTGLRKSNVTGLLWSQVDLDLRLAWIHPDQAKARQPIPVPLNTEAHALLHSLRGAHAVNVFTYRGRPVSQVNTKAWRAALKRAGISNFRWHDLRHTWASWLAQKGTPLHVLQEMGGWESAEMVRRYAHFSAEHLAPYAERLSGIGLMELV